MTTQQFLTPKQQFFCDEYLKDMNATRAALRAGYSKATALNGSLMQLPKIKLFLQQQTEAASATANVNHATVLAELGKIAFSNMRDYFLPDGSLKPIQDFTPDESAALHSITIAKNGAVTIRMNNKLAALEKIIKLLSLDKPQTKKPEKVYVYLDHEEMSEDDTFDDDELEEEMEEALKEKQETRTKMQDEDEREEFNEHALGKPANVDGDGNVFRDGAGIPYGPVDRSRYCIDLNETPDELLARMKKYGY